MTGGRNLPHSFEFRPSAGAQASGRGGCKLVRARSPSLALQHVHISAALLTRTPEDLRVRSVSWPKRERPALCAQRSLA